MFESTGLDQAKIAAAQQSVSEASASDKRILAAKVVVFSLLTAGAVVLVVLFNS